MPGSPTPNLGLTQGTVAGDTGVWGGSPGINGNNTVLDSVIGQVTTISLNNSNVVLNAAQFQSAELVFSSTLTGSVTITFPTSFIKGYTIQHLCTGSSAFTITLTTTAAGGQAICAPPGEAVDIISDGTNLKYRNFGRVGSYWDYAGSSVPAWVSGCTVPPYLNCDGTTFSSATYPQLAVILTVTTLPDARGRFRATLNQGTNNITTAGGGMNGDLRSSLGGAQTITISSTNLPASIPYTDPGHAHDFKANSGAANAASPSGNILGAVANPPLIYRTPEGGNVTMNAQSIAANSVGITINAGSANTPMTNIPPGYMGGLTLIRAG